MSRFSHESFNPHVRGNVRISLLENSRFDIAITIMIVDPRFDITITITIVDLVISLTTRYSRLDSPSLYGYIRNVQVGLGTTNDSFL